MYVYIYVYVASVLILSCRIYAALLFCGTSGSLFVSRALGVHTFVSGEPVCSYVSGGTSGLYAHTVLRALYRLTLLRYLLLPICFASPWCPYFCLWSTSVFLRFGGNVRVQVHVYIYIYICMLMCVYICVYVYLSLYVCMYVYMYV